MNTLASNVATLNQEILVAEGAGSEASGLRDQRQEYLKEISELVDVQLLRIARMARSMFPLLVVTAL